VNELRRGLSDHQEDALARYRSGTMPAAERAVFEREVLANDVLAEALYSEQGLDAVSDRSVARARSAFPRGLAIAASLVAVAGAVVLLPRLAGHRPERGEILRGGDATAAAPLEPLGDIAGPPTSFRWRRDPGAESYRLEIFGADGRKAVTTVTGDTVIAAATVGVDTLTSGSWRVVPIAADGHERPSSPAVHFGAPR